MVPESNSNAPHMVMLKTRCHEKPGEIYRKEQVFVQLIAGSEANAPRIAAVTLRMTGPFYREERIGRQSVNKFFSHIAQRSLSELWTRGRCLTADPDGTTRWTTSFGGEEFPTTQESEALSVTKDSTDDLNDFAPSMVHVDSCQGPIRRVPIRVIMLITME